MEIVYIWVSKLRNLEKLSFNLSNEIDFSFNSDNGRIEQQEKKEIYVKNLFGSTVIGLTAVVGENGAGKSTLFYLIKIISNDLKVNFLDAKIRKRNQQTISKVGYIVIFKVENKYYFFKNGIENKIEADFSELSRQQKKHIDNFHCFYYANFFDYSSSQLFDHVYDLSTTSVVNTTYNEIRGKTIENEEHIYEADFLNNYKLNEIFSQIQFVSNFNSQIPFDLPTTLSIQLYLKNHPTEEDFPEDGEIDKDLSEDEKKNYEDDKKYYEAIEIVERIIIKYRGELSTEPSQNELNKFLKTKIQQAVLANLLQDNVFHSTTVIGHYELNFDITEYYNSRKISATKNLDKLFADILDLISTGEENYNGNKFIKWIDELVNIIDVQKHYNIKESIIYINLDEIDRNRFLKLIMELSKMEFGSRFLNFFWDGISSGENALITLFSRFYKFSRYFSTPGATLLLIFDECEINFHPAWQRKLIYFLTTIFPLIFNRAKLQFFISSHSPLILSDIPKSNIIFLKKGQDRKVTVAHLADKKQTFAANIHTLLSDSFFMDEGTIGEIAKEKINWVIDVMGKKYLDFEENLPLIETLVEIIGEPIIKSKLISMINEKQSLNFHSMNQRIKYLERRSKK